MSVSTHNWGAGELKGHLLDERRGSADAPTELRACLNSHGLYNSFQFVLRLSPEVHRRVNAIPAGIITRHLDFDDIQAYSTYLHETIHWWQHIGSTAGLLLSLSYPAQAHANHTHLKDLVARTGPKKSIRRWVESRPGPGGDPNTADGLANVILNNHFDIEFYRILITDPRLVREFVEDPLFDCVGHSYVTAYANILFTLASTTDEHFSVLPDPRLWQDEFMRLRSERVRGYYFRSDVVAVPFGAREIFEGQARFTQLQYLYFARGGKLGWDDVRSKGMLKGTYGIAFENFLRIANLEWPESIDHPVVALFLLICDIAINPAAGFPAGLRSFGTFIEDVDPGMRFIALCYAVGVKCPATAAAIREYSRSEYLHVAQELTEYACLHHPLRAALEMREWPNRSETVKLLMREYESFDYSGINLPIRVLFSHFLAFNADKLQRPEFFCWPGAWMTGHRVSNEIGELFQRHSALFIDKEDDDGVFPRLLPGRNADLVDKTFNAFYAANVTYDMARQWIGEDGPFRYQYEWLSSAGTQADFKEFADRHFELAFRVLPDTFEIL